MLDAVQGEGEGEVAYKSIYNFTFLCAAKATRLLTCCGS